MSVTTIGGLPSTINAVRPEVAKTGNYTVLPADNGSTFSNAGAAGTVIFTLPAIAVGYDLTFHVVANQTVQISSAEGTNIVWDNVANASSLAFSTVSHKIGGRLRFYSNAAGTQWYVENHSPATCTVTQA